MLKSREGIACVLMYCMKPMDGAQGYILAYITAYEQEMQRLMERNRQAEADELTESTSGNHRRHRSHHHHRRNHHHHHRNHGHHH